MSRKQQRQVKVAKPKHRVNHQIRVPQIRVIGPEGAQLGIMSPRDALEIARDSGLDLVEVAPRARPPVCRILDYGKFRYEQSKKSSAKSTKVSVKEVRLRPKTDTHDLETKLKRATTFLSKGDRVKLVMRMRGRELAHTGLWVEKVREFIQALGDIAIVVAHPRNEGRAISAMIEPNPQSVALLKEREKEEKEAKAKGSKKHQDVEVVDDDDHIDDSEE